MADKVYPPVTFEEFQPTSYEVWKEEAVTSLKGGDFQKKLFTKTYEGITLQPIYTKADMEYIQETSTFPGREDYLRGAAAAGYIADRWDVAQAVEGAAPTQANADILHELEKGATAVNLTIGRKGVVLECSDDVRALFAGVDLTKTPVYLDCGAAAQRTLSLLSLADVDLKTLKGCVGGDPYGTLLADGRLPVTMEKLFDEMAETVKLGAGVRTVLVDGLVYANGGATAVQEVGACMATASAYLSAMLERGIDPDTAAQSIQFRFALGANFFMEIAKLRAARMVYAQIAEAYGASEEARKLHVFARTSAFTKTAYDPYVNILRTTTEAFSGVVGGVDAMEVAPLDEPFGSSEELTRRIARNIQVMMQEEFHLTQPVDPAGGSWYVETLTAQLAESIWAYFQNIESKGGIESVILSGTLQDDVAATLAQRFKNLDTRADRAVGVNMYANVLEQKLDRPAPKAVPAPAGPAVVTAKPIEAHRWTERYEALRAKTEAWMEKTGKTLDVFLANMGPIPQHKARADFAAGFFEVAHFNMLRNDGFPTVDACADAAVKSGAPVVVICSTDATYPEIVPELARKIKTAKPDTTVLLAGAPAPEYKDAYLEAGVEDFIHVKANCYDILSKIQSTKGVE